MVGSRRDWKSDRWRFLKIGTCLVPVFVLCAWLYGSITLHFVECMAGIAVFTFTYLWVFSFVPRSIALYKDRIAIFRGGSRQGSAAIKAYYSDIKQAQVIPENGIYLVKLTLVSGKEIALYAREKNDLDALDTLRKGAPITQC